MIKSRGVKEAAKALGADLCGIATANGFTRAPEGFRPADIYPASRSVVVFAKRLPAAAAYGPSRVAYTQTVTTIHAELDRIALALAVWLEERGSGAVMIPSDDPYEHWEPERQHGRAILSLKHAAELAGLGVLGRNTLLVNETYGNLISLGAVLAEAELEPDPPAGYQACREGCLRCVRACPQSALDGTACNQNLCRQRSGSQNERGFFLKNCNLCRVICPNALGLTGGAETRDRLAAMLHHRSW
jgi:epoxyqueuosine reductase QueG